MNSDREARKKALEAAKERLAYRRKQKEQLQLLRQQKQSGGGTGFGNQTENIPVTAKQNDYGKKLVSDTKQLISNWSSTKASEEEKLINDLANDDAKDNTKQIVPGPRADLNIVHSINSTDLMKRSRVEYVKEVQTDSVEIGQHSNIITEQTSNTQLNEILATFIESDVYPYPGKTQELYNRITIINEEKADEKQADFDEKKEKEEETEEILVLSIESATKLISSSTFIDAFRTKSHFVESALGINAEHSIFIEASAAILGGVGGKQDHQMEKLIKSSEIALPYTANRAITCLDYDTRFGDRFAASYSGRYYSLLNANANAEAKENNFLHNNIEADGLINIFDFANLAVIRRLECQSQINCVTFHPTKPNMMIGASVSGQVLGWDIRLNKKTPTIRTEFSSACHTQPIFALNFLPTSSMIGGLPSTKIQQILTLSNDAKLCVWRDDMLYKPNNEFLLKLSKASSSSNSGHGSSNQAKEITTTCFSYPKRYNTNNKLWLGSDEGCIYSCNLNLNRDEKELAITSYISGAHYGPITCIDFHIKNNLYLTSSFDWTVKLWHTASSKPVALFNQMQDYVYDVRWSPTNPSIFAVGDGGGNLTIFDLNSSFEHPASEPTNITDFSASSSRLNVEQVSITKILWSPNGKKIIVGDSNGKISIFDCPVYDAVDNDFDKFEAIIKRKLDSNDR